MATVTVTEQLDLARPPTATRSALSELGYEQELKRGMGIFDSVAMGFATISPVVGLYAVVLVGMVVAGGAWVWVLPVALAGQCLLLAVYSELAAQVAAGQRRLPVDPPAGRRRATAGSPAGSRCAPTPSPTPRSPTSARRGR